MINKSFTSVINEKPNIITSFDYDKLVQHYFLDGHPPAWLSSEYNRVPSDLWILALDYVETQVGYEVYDQNGGENCPYTIDKDGKIKFTYTLYDLQLTEDDDPVDFNFNIEGYLITNDKFTNDCGNYLFITKFELI